MPLINIASNIILRSQLYLNQALKTKNLSSAEGNILMFLYGNGDGVNQDAIVAGVDVSKPAISRTINSLEHKGYISRQAGADDRRARIVFLTEQAKTAREFVQGVYADYVAIAAKGIPTAKMDEFIHLLQGVSENIDACLRAIAEQKTE